MGQPYEQKGIPVFSTAADLRALDAQPFPGAFPIAFLLGIATPQDGNECFVEWKATNTGTDDNQSTFQPNWIPSGAAGRWCRVRSGSGNGNATLNIQSTNYTLTSADATVIFDATAATRICTVPRNLGSPTVSPKFWLGLKAASGTNVLQIQDDLGTLIDQVSAPPNGGAMSGRWVFSDGTNVWSQNA